MGVGRAAEMRRLLSAAALARALNELLSAPEKCDRFGQYGRQTVLERYSWDSAGKRIRQQIEEAIP
jgi:glycosyltransferase involved in cell wall biosynthesis